MRATIALITCLISLSTACTTGDNCTPTCSELGWQSGDPAWCTRGSGSAEPSRCTFEGESCVMGSAEICSR